MFDDDSISKIIDELILEGGLEFAGADPETGEITLISPPTQIKGYHYNYRTIYGNKPPIPLPVELEPYLVTPKNPRHVFF